MYIGQKSRHKSTNGVSNVSVPHLYCDCRGSWDDDCIGAAVVVIRRKRRSRESDEQRKENDDVDAMFPEVQGVPFLGMALGLLKAQHPAHSDQVKWALTKGKEICHVWVAPTVGSTIWRKLNAFKDKADHRKLRNLLSKGISKNTSSKLLHSVNPPRRLFAERYKRRPTSRICQNLHLQRHMLLPRAAPTLPMKTSSFLFVTIFGVDKWTRGSVRARVLVWISPFAKGMKARERIVAKVMEVVRDRRGGWRAAR
ncbi:hypothetical protein BC829DRAFT_436607, partial [Chytridium lagenaria]